ncbi:MAG: PAS domain-containing protein [Candidatus Zixiibacteriota bacterium]
MLDAATLSAILDSLDTPVQFVTPDHIIRYMNKAAIAHFKEGDTLLGRSLMDCHNEQSQATIHEVLAALRNGESERLITDKPEQRIYMRAVRNPVGEVIGYYERYERRDTSGAQLDSTRRKQGS